MSRILVVDDEEMSQSLMEEALRSGGHDVVTVSNGKEALELLRQDADIRAVVTDLRMPLVNGLRLIRALRDAGDSIPIIAVSGTNADQLMLAEDYGANAGLTKPLNRDELLQVVDRALSATRSSWSNAWIHPEFGEVGDH